MELAPAQQDHQYASEVLPDGTALLNGQYTIERYLSSGGFGITYYARDSLDRRVVIKECFPEAYCARKNRTVLARSQSHQGEFRSIVDMFVREAHSIAKLSHPNIVGVHQVFQDNETAYMALDLIDGKDLLDIIEATEERPSYDEVSAILLKLLDAIVTVHDQDMLHRDISPDNILIDAWDNPILIDFGAAREEASKKSRALSAVLVVKDGYSPQEFYIAGSHQTPCSDLYALGATFFHLISGDAPPNSQSRLAAIASSKDDPCVPLAGRIAGYPREFLEAIDTAMNVFPPDRIQTAQEWILRIDARKRHAAALAHARDDANIENTVMQLIQSAQSEVKPAPVEKVNVSVPPPVQKKPEQPVAVKVAAPPVKESPKRPTRESLEIDDMLARNKLRRPPSATKAKDEADWIAKARQKPKPEVLIPLQQVEVKLIDWDQIQAHPATWIVLVAIFFGLLLLGGLVA